MLGAQQVDRAARRRVSDDELVRQRLGLAVDRLGDRDRQVGSPPCEQREQQRLGGVVDPVDGGVIERARHGRGALALPALEQNQEPLVPERQVAQDAGDRPAGAHRAAELLVGQRSEEHTSELQSPCNLVCRLLLEKKKKKQTVYWYTLK